MKGDVEPCRWELGIDQIRREMETELGHLRVLIHHERELREADARSNAQALVVAAKRLDEHLELLNGHADRVKEIQAQAITRETFDLWRAKVDEIQTRLHAGWIVFLVLLGLLQYWM